MFKTTKSRKDIYKGVNMDTLIGIIVAVIVAGIIIKLKKPEWIDTIKGWLGL
jgi:Co/Zn/Cd efflux system component